MHIGSGSLNLKVESVPLKDDCERGALWLCLPRVREGSAVHEAYESTLHVAMIKREKYPSKTKTLPRVNSRYMLAKNVASEASLVLAHTLTYGVGVPVLTSGFIFELR